MTADGFFSTTFNILKTNTNIRKETSDAICNTKDCRNMRWIDLAFRIERSPAATDL